MNVVAVIGSPHGMEGSTGLLLGAAMEGAREAGAGVQTFELCGMEVRPCRGCDTCHRTGRCVIEDDFLALRRALEGCDAAVVASPNYISSVSAQTKAMMDRCAPLIHTHGLDGTYGAAVVSSGGEESERVERYVCRFLRSVGCWTVGGVGASAAGLHGEERGPALERARELGAGLVRAAREGAEFPEQREEKGQIRRRMIELVASRGEEWRYELEYWKSRGEL